MPKDALLQLQASVTKTATFNGTALDLLTGTPERGMVANIIYSAAHNASGANTVTFSIDVSDDNASWTSRFLSDVLTLSTTAQAGEINLRFSTRHRYVRLTVTIAGAGSTPTITYEGWLSLARE